MVSSRCSSGKNFLLLGVNVLCFFSLERIHGLHSPTTNHLFRARTKSNSRDDGAELFSVAPMMGHTNRHYRFFFGQLSQRAWLYTEMIPATRIVQSFLAASTESHPKEANSAYLGHSVTLSHVKRLQHEYDNGSKMNDPVLEELLNPGPNPAVLQLGGRDPDALAQAAAIGAAFGFHAINLNCGCPSTSVSARSTGASLMREPQLVSRCLEAMSESMDTVDPSTILSVKHRLGVKDAAEYDAELDHAQGDEEAYQTCHEFVRSISGTSKLSRIQVHARVALLGFNVANNDEAHEPLWAPSSNPTSSSSSSSTTSELRSIKVNHQRAQYHAKRRAREVTLQNRSVPPLRPGVVDQIALDFPSLQVSSNGGIDNLDEIQRRIHNNSVAGGMVGRAAINHPCSFAAADTILWKETPGGNLMTRRQVLLRYIEYCQEQESRLEYVLGDSVQGTTKWRKEVDSMAWHRRRLVAPVFHLFMGEEGNQGYQRRLRKLVGRGDRHSTPSMLLAAMTEVPSFTLDKPIHEHMCWDEIPKYDYIKRAGAMQRTIH